MTRRQLTRIRTNTIAIEPLTEPDVPAADHLMRLAFGTFLGMPDPMAFMSDAECIRTRWRADPTGGFCAKDGGEVIGAAFAMRWGSVGVLGPLVTHPHDWNQGIGSALLEPIMARFDEWGVTHAGLFTFAQSPKHLGLYQKFGFWPRYLTAITSKPIRSNGQTTPGSTLFSDTPEDERTTTLAACREMTGAIYDGLDVTLEINAVAAQGLGDTVLIWDDPVVGRDARLVGFAICHCGPGSEAGSGACYVKFAAIRPGPQASEPFDRLLDACEALGAARGLSRLVVGVNTARHEAYRRLLAHGFRSDTQGVTMHRPNEVGYNRSDVYLLDDWR